MKKFLLYPLVLCVWFPKFAKSQPCADYQQIESSFIELGKRYPGQVSMMTGRSALGNQIYFMTIQSSEKFSGERPVVYLSGATHGDEYMNIVDRLPHFWLSGDHQTGFQTFVGNGGIVLLAPIVNPDGFCWWSESNDDFSEGGGRYNGNHVDLNRDFPLVKSSFKGQTQPETKFILSSLKNQLRNLDGRLVLTWDYHCCLEPGRLLYPWGFRKADGSRPRVTLSKKHLRAHLQVAGIVKNVFDYASGTPWEEEFAPGMPLGGVHGASDDYFYETYFLRSSNIGRAFTFEGQKNEPKRFLDHIKMWDQIFKLIIQEQQMGPKITPF